MKSGRINKSGDFSFIKNGDDLKLVIKKKIENIQGHWKDGKVNGQGKVTFTSGLKWIGEFRENKDWNTKGYDINGNLVGEYMNGKHKNYLRD